MPVADEFDVYTARAIRRVIDRAGMTPYATAKLSGVDKSALYRVLNEQEGPSWKMIKRLAAVKELETSIAELAGATVTEENFFQPYVPLDGEISAEGVVSSESFNEATTPGSAKHRQGGAPRPQMVPVHGSSPGAFAVRVVGLEKPVRVEVDGGSIVHDLHPNDIVMIEPQRGPVHGDLVHAAFGKDAQRSRLLIYRKIDGFEMLWPVFSGQGDQPTPLGGDWWIAGVVTAITRLYR